MSTRTRDVAVSLRDNLVRYRETRELTQVQLGAKAGIAPASVSHFETGQRVPSIESLVKLADALKVSVDSLLGRVGPEIASQIDPIFLRASQASSDKLDTVRRVTAALLGERVKP